MKDEARILTAIGAVCGWYTALNRGYNNINEMMYKRQKLNGYTYAATDALEKAISYENKAQYEYERKKDGIRAAYLDKGVTKAEALAKAKTSAEKQEATQWKSAAISIREKIRQANRVSESMSQHIAILRKEMENTKKN